MNASNSHISPRFGHELSLKETSTASLLARLEYLRSIGLSVEDWLELEAIELELEERGELEGRTLAGWIKSTCDKAAGQARQARQEKEKTDGYRSS